MKRYFAPLGIFLGGQILLLILWLLLPQMGSAGDTLAANAHIDTFWGMGWAAGSLRLLIIVLGELFVLVTALFVFVKTKSS